MTDLSSALYTAFYSALNTISYGGSTIGCYSFAPNDAEMPYIVLDNPIYIENGTKDRALFDTTINVKIYDASDSREATTNAIDAIGNSVINTILTTITERISLSGYATVDVKLDNVVILSPEMTETQAIWIKIIRFRLIIEE